MTEQQRRVVRNSATNLNRPLSKAPRTKIRPWKVVRTIGIVLLLMAAVYIVLGTTLLRVRTVKVEGAAGSVAADIQKNIELQLSQNIFSSNVLSLNTRQMEVETKHQIPLVETIHIRLALPLSLVASVQLHQAQLRWRSGVENFAVADDGRAFRRSSDSDSTLPQVVDNSNVPVQEGQQVASEQFVKFVREIYSQLPGITGDVKSYDVYDTTYEISALTAAGYRVKLDTARSATDQLADLKAVLDLIKKQGKKINEYIDVRIPARAFYK